MIKTLIKLLEAGIIVKLLHSLNLGWYSTRLTFVLVNRIEIDLFDTILFFIIVSFLLLMVWKNPNLEAKPKKAYNAVKYSFHIAILGYIIWEGIHTGNYARMGTSLFFYGIIELIIYIIHYSFVKSDKGNKSPPNKITETKTSNG